MTMTTKAIVNSIMAFVNCSAFISLLEVRTMVIKASKSALDSVIMIEPIQTRQT